MEYTISILLLPMLTFLVLGLFGMKLRPNTAGYIGSLSLAVTTGLAYITAGLYFSSPRVDGVFARIMPVDFEWLRFTEALHIDLGILLDPISVMMLVVITTVSLMVHIYSMGYMKGERGFQRYYAFLSLFTFSMLGLVVAPNIFQMYIFWELVGVSSYLLIGFYYTKPEAIAASKKAFIVTRFADLGFFCRICFIATGEERNPCQNAVSWPEIDKIRARAQRTTKFEAFPSPTFLRILLPAPQQRGTARSAIAQHQP